MISAPKLLTAFVVIVLLLGISPAPLALAQEESAPTQEESAPTDVPPAEEDEGVLKWIEERQPGKWVRESSSMFAYAGILLMHTVGMSLVVGINAGIDLRILGLAREMPLAPLNKFFPVLWIGFFVNAITGLLLLLADMSTTFVLPDFWAKIVFIVLAIVALQRLRRTVFDDPKIDSKPLPSSAKMLAAASLLFWVGAVSAGRLIAYLK